MRLFIGNMPENGYGSSVRNFEGFANGLISIQNKKYPVPKMQSIKEISGIRWRVRSYYRTRP